MFWSNKVPGNKEKGSTQTQPLMDQPSTSAPGAASSSPSGTTLINARSVLSEGTVIQGKLSFDTPVKIDGKLTGEVISTKPLVVGKTGIVEARIEVESLIVMGKVIGNVVALNKVEILAGGSIEGDIVTPALEVTDGIFNGNCKMLPRAKIEQILKHEAVESVQKSRAVPEKIRATSVSA